MGSESAHGYAHDSHCMVVVQCRQLSLAACNQGSAWLGTTFRMKDPNVQSNEAVKSPACVGRNVEQQGD
ncbi:hypothetical protein E2C01_078932 [Portunus trituberculatus]|uniref:Uncharacterized protein n=1 Tax=Portunus trituberculatus TaxID=210409 RepID=A0A5B7IPA3_PORTR|nr:hypothetical protein [Portunus trituberculatus]